MEIDRYGFTRLNGLSVRPNKKKIRSIRLNPQSNIEKDRYGLTQIHQISVWPTISNPLNPLKSVEQ